VSIPFILLPFFVQVALIFALLLRVGGQRLDAVGRDRVQPAADALDIQFQLPILFLVLAPLAILTRKADYLFVALAWIFVILRIAHGAAFVAADGARMRFGLFAAGALALLLMWIVFAAHILLAV
jgi:hypothetical protein